MKQGALRALPDAGPLRGAWGHLGLAAWPDMPRQHRQRNSSALPLSSTPPRTQHLPMSVAGDRSDAAWNARNALVVQRPRRVRVSTRVLSGRPRQASTAASNGPNPAPKGAS